MGNANPVSILGQRLRKFRIREGMSQNQLAIKAGVDRVLITNIESGKSQTMFVDNAAAIARALGISLDMLVGGDPLENREDEKMAAVV